MGADRFPASDDDWDESDDDDDVGRNGVDSADGYQLLPQDFPHDQQPAGNNDDGKSFWTSSTSVTRNRHKNEFAYRRLCFLGKNCLMCVRKHHFRFIWNNATQKWRFQILNTTRSTTTIIWTFQRSTLAPARILCRWKRKRKEIFRRRRFGKEPIFFRNPSPDAKLSLEMKRFLQFSWRWAKLGSSFYFYASKIIWEDFSSRSWYKIIKLLNQFIPLLPYSLLLVLSFYNRDWRVLLDVYYFVCLKKTKNKLRRVQGWSTFKKVFNFQPTAVFNTRLGRQNAWWTVEPAHSWQTWNRSSKQIRKTRKSRKRCFRSSINNRLKCKRSEWANW